MKFKRRQPLVFTDLSDPVETGSAETLSEAVAAAPAVAAEETLTLAQPAAPTTPRPAPAPRRDADASGWSRFAYPVAVAAALVWAGGLVAFVLGFQTQFGAFDYGALQWVVIGALAALPAAFILLAAAAVRQGARLAAETSRARALADDLAIPAALAADQTGGAMDAMRREIEKASLAALEAQGPIASLREALAEESRKLAETAADAQAAGRKLAETLGRERNALSEIAGALQAQADEAVQALTAQTRIVADTSDLAQAQLHEAQAALAARAADLTVAAADAGEAANLAATQLAHQVDRLESTGGGIAERLNRLQLSVARERDELSALSEGLRLDQEDIAVQFETRRAQLTEAAAEARTSAEEIGQASDSGAEALRGLIATAAEEVRRLAETAQREQALMDEKARASVSLFSGVAAEERASLEAQTRAAIDQLAAAAEEARRAAAGHIQAASQAADAHAGAAQAKLDQLAEAATSRIDDLGEAAFAAAQKADGLFEARITAARRMIEQSAVLVEETGQKSAERIEAGLASAREALGDMQALLSQIDERFDRLPQEARERAEQVREAIEQGVGDLTAAARRAAEETQAIDAAFQERVRRNYEVLSEAVRLMGRVAGAAVGPGEPLARPTPPIQTLPTSLQPPEAVETAAPLELRPAIAVGDRSLHVATAEAATARGPDPLRPAALAEPTALRAAPPPAEPTPSAAAGLRPRLRLTPAPSDEPAAAIFEPRPVLAEAPPSPVRVPPVDSATDEWTWKDLLSSMDEPVDDEALADKLMGEIGALGIDAAALLPRARVEEIAAVMQAGDSSGAREVVRRLAPAAVRRLSRRVLTDKVLRGEADRYVRRYESLVTDSVARDGEGFMASALLGSEAGRAFLLLDAAIGDLA